METFYAPKVNLDRVVFDDLVEIEHDDIYWNGKDKRPFSDFQERIHPEAKRRILYYLKHGAEYAACPGRLIDDKTGMYLPLQWLYFTDGKYSWTSKTIYQFDHYDMKLPDEFIQSILGDFSSFVLVP